MSASRAQGQEGRSEASASSKRPSGHHFRAKRSADLALGLHPRPRGKTPRGCTWDEVRGGWKSAESAQPDAPRKRDAAYAKELFGLLLSVPETAWGGQWASSMENIQGMIVNYSSGIFTVRFPPAHETADIYVRWPHVLGETDWSGVRLELLLPRSGALPRRARRDVLAAAPAGGSAQVRGAAILLHVGAEASRVVKAQSAALRARRRVAHRRREAERRRHLLHAAAAALRLRQGLPEL